MTKLKTPTLLAAHTFILAEAAQIKTMVDMCGRENWEGNADAKADFDHLIDIARGLELIDIDLQIKGDRHGTKSR